MSLPPPVDGGSRRIRPRPCLRATLAHTLRPHCAAHLPTPPARLPVPHACRACTRVRASRPLQRQPDEPVRPILAVEIPAARDDLLELRCGNRQAWADLANAARLL